MRRRNLVMDGQLLDEAVRVLGVKTYSAAVNEALKEVVRRNKTESLAEFFGKRLWQGNLSAMRDDSRSPKKSR